MWSDVCDTLSQNFFFCPAPHVTSLLKHLYNLLHIIWRSDWVCKSLWEDEHPNQYYDCAAYFLNLCNANNEAMTNCIRLACNVPETMLFYHLRQHTNWTYSLLVFVVVVVVFFLIQPSIPSQTLDLLPSSRKNRHETYSTGPNGFNQPPPPTNNSISSQSKNNLKASQEISHIIPNWCPFSYIKKSMYCTIQGEEQMTCLFKKLCNKNYKKQRSWMCKP